MVGSGTALTFFLAIASMTDASSALSMTVALRFPVCQ
jgi:hypothetical protein